MTGHDSDPGPDFLTRLEGAGSGGGAARLEQGWRLARRAHCLSSQVALLNLQGLFFSSVLLNREGINNPHFNYRLQV